MPAFNIHTDPGVPGLEIVADKQANGDVCVALRDAFDAGGRCKRARTR
jgi:hypothetical protein